MDTAVEPPVETPEDEAKPQPMGVFGVVYCTLLVIANLLILRSAWEDRSWGALGLAWFGGPMLNGAFAIVGAMAIPFLMRFRPQFVLSQHVRLTFSLPVIAAAADFFIIMSMDLHGC